MNKIQVAIDGPVASGKSTVGSAVAAGLHFLFIDSGLMYRAVAWKIQRLSAIAEKEKWGEIAESIQLDWQGDPVNPRILADGAEISDQLSLPEISSLTSEISVNSRVRKKIVALQREIAGKQDVVMVGRDTGTVVLPEASVKVFLTASLEARARRRFLELQEKKIKIALEFVKAEILDRDKRDSSRADSPLQAASDAMILDSTGLTPGQVAEKIISRVRCWGQSTGGQSPTDIKKARRDGV